MQKLQDLLLNWTVLSPRLFPGTGEARDLLFGLSLTWLGACIGKAFQRLRSFPGHWASGDVRRWVTVNTHLSLETGNARDPAFLAPSGNVTLVFSAASLWVGALRRNCSGEHTRLTSTDQATGRTTGGRALKQGAGRARVSVGPRVPSSGEPPASLGGAASHAWLTHPLFCLVRGLLLLAWGINPRSPEAWGSAGWGAKAWRRDVSPDPAELSAAECGPVGVWGRGGARRAERRSWGSVGGTDGVGAVQGGVKTRYPESAPASRVWQRGAPCSWRPCAHSRAPYSEHSAVSMRGGTLQTAADSSPANLPFSPTRPEPRV